MSDVSDVSHSLDEEARAIEAILMVAEAPVPTHLLAQLLELAPDRIDGLCAAMAAAYEAEGRGFQLVRVAGGYRFQSHPDQSAYVERFVLDGQSARLSAAALETLAIVAYKQPISRAESPPSAVSTSTASSAPSPTAATSPRWDAIPVRVRRSSTAPPTCSWRSWPSTPSRSSRRSASSCPMPRWSRPSRRACGRRRTMPADPRSGREGTGTRLQKVLAQAGVGSRRVAEELIAAGRVKVNGRVAELGNRVDPGRDRVEVDGVVVGVAPGLVYYLLNKPAGVVTTAADTHGRPTVLDLVPAAPRVFSVGRLDQATEGLLLMTNDGDLAHRLTHPSFGVDKEYLVEVDGAPSRGALRRLREGVELEDGPTAPARVAQVAPNLIRITIHEGRKRQVRRMFDAIGHPVLRLVRTRIGPISDRRLAPGEWRMLETDEVRTLERAAAAAATAVKRRK